MANPAMIRICRVSLTALAVFAAAPVSAQSRTSRDTPTEVEEQAPPSRVETAQPGATATTGTGQVGQRQSTANAAPNIQPLGRYQSRINSRIPSRINSRLDRGFNAQASTADRFRRASDQAENRATRPQ